MTLHIHEKFPDEGILTNPDRLELRFSRRAGEDIPPGFILEVPEMVPRGVFAHSREYSSTCRGRFGFRQRVTHPIQGDLTTLLGFPAT